MGHDRRTIQSLKVVAVRPDDQAILIAGAVPGHKGAYVRVSPAVKKPAATA
jgi:large subunit ribosomal protein L3